MSTADADEGDTTTIEQTLVEAAEQLEQAAAADETVEELSEAVTDKGYHSNAVLTALAEIEVRSYVSEPKRGRRKWGGRERERKAVYANRRRIKGERGKRLLRLRAEKVERSFAHCYETGRLRRTHLRGRENILKRLLIHVGGYNLSLALRRKLGAGTPRGLPPTFLSVTDFLVTDFLVFSPTFSVTDFLPTFSAEFGASH